MTTNGYLQIGLFLVTLFILIKPLGEYMAKVYENRPTYLHRLLSPVEKFIYKVCGIDPTKEMNWKTYALALMLFSGLGLVTVYALQRLQGLLPLNPEKMGAVDPELAFNTAVSFLTNTNWQAYGGETTMSYLTQMLAFTVQNFISAAKGMAVMAALIRGLVRRETSYIGNFWADLVRGTLYILLPLAFIFALVFVSQGVVQTISPYAKVELLEKINYDNPVLDAQGQPVLGPDGKPKTEAASTKEQTIALGPAASQVSIKLLGTNGGGFFNVNSAHPFENPTPL
ncbi:MAG: potassium-transporting ATPase subunit KdpA, partial [Deltaproteobacteria bacterium]|nr:potassium-transporting ATPase subunit KdpA [Deltaproteobacteria bacterium]